MTEREWADLAITIHDAYGRPVTEGYIEMWFPAVAAFTRDEVHAALMAHGRSSQARFMPTGGELAEYARAAAGDGEPGFDEVWTEIMGQVASVGWCGRPELSETAAGVVAFLGGWRNVCVTPYDQHGTMRAQAREAVAAGARRRQTIAAATELRALTAGAVRRIESVENPDARRLANPDDERA